MSGRRKGINPTTSGRFKAETVSKVAARLNEGYNGDTRSKTAEKFGDIAGNRIDESPE